MELFKKWTLEWATHVRSYLRNRDKFYGVRYEELVGDKEKEIKRIIAYGFGVGSKDYYEFCGRIGAALESTDRDRFRVSAPDHIHRGRPGGWRQEWTEEQNSLFFDQAGEEMVKLGYE